MRSPVLRYSFPRVRWPAALRKIEHRRRRGVSVNTIGSEKFQKGSAVLVAVGANSVCQFEARAALRAAMAGVIPGHTFDPARDLGVRRDRLIP
jgi:hypothetical protein